MKIKLLEIAGRWSIGVILMSIIWNICLQIDMSLLDWIMLILHSILLFIWIVLPTIWEE